MDQIGEEQKCATTRRRSDRRRPETRDEEPESAKGTKPRRSDARTVNGDTQRATDGSDLRVEGKETRRRACGLVNRAVWGPLPHTNTSNDHYTVHTQKYHGHVT